MEYFHTYIHTYIHAYIHNTLLHSSPLGAPPPYMNIKISSYKEKRKKLFTDKNIDYKNSLHFDNKIVRYDV